MACSAGCSVMMTMIAIETEAATLIVTVTIILTATATPTVTATQTATVTVTKVIARFHLRRRPRRFIRPERHLRAPNARAISEACVFSLLSSSAF